MFIAAKKKIRCKNYSQNNSKVYLTENNARKGLALGHMKISFDRNETFCTCMAMMLFI
jgi:hypothetical protein